MPHILDRCLDALKPFADAAKAFDEQAKKDEPGDPPYIDEHEITVSLGDCRAAAKIVDEWARKD